MSQLPKLFKVHLFGNIPKLGPNREVAFIKLGYFLEYPKGIKITRQNLFRLKACVMGKYPLLVNRHKYLMSFGFEVMRIL